MFNWSGSDLKEKFETNFVCIRTRGPASKSFQSAKFDLQNLFRFGQPLVSVRPADSLTITHRS